MSRIENVVSNVGAESATLRNDALNAVSTRIRELGEDESAGVAAATCKTPAWKVNICGIGIAQGCDRIEITWWDGRETWISR